MHELWLLFRIYCQLFYGMLIIVSNPVKKHVMRLVDYIICCVYGSKPTQYQNNSSSALVAVVEP